MLQFESSVDFRSAQIKVRRFFETIDAEAFAKRILGLSADIRRNGFLKIHYREHYELEFELTKLYLALADNSNLPMLSKRAEVRAFEFAFLFTSIFERLSSSHQQMLKGKFLDGVKDVKGLASLELELSTISHLMVKDFEIALGESVSQRFDILAKQADLEFEVECKHMGSDSGRKIHFRPFSELANALLQSAVKVHAIQGRFIHISLAIDGPLTSNHDEMKRFSQKWRTDFEAGNSIGIFKNIFWCTREVFPPGENGPKTSIQSNWMFDFAKARQRQQEELAHFDEAASGTGFLITAVNDYPNTMISDLEKTLLRSAKKQFTGNRPSVFIVRSPSLSDEMIRKFHEYDSKGISPLKKLANTLFFRRPHLHSVCFRGYGDISKDSKLTQTHQVEITRAAGAVYVFKNESCRYVESTKVDLFYGD